MRPVRAIQKHDRNGGDGSGVVRDGRSVNHFLNGNGRDGCGIRTGMTLESRILQQLGAGPVRKLTLDGVDPDELALTLKFMAARRQICMRPDQISLYWHRHMILSPMAARVRKLEARPAMGA